MATFRDRVAELNAELTLDSTEYSAGLAAVETRTQRAAGEIAQAGVGMSNRMRGALQNTSFQIADIAVQLESGTPAARVFAQQGSQIAAAFGPAGAAIGAAIAVGLPLGALLLDLGSGSREAADAFDELTESLNGLSQLAPGAAVNIQKIIDTLATLRGEARQLAEEGIRVETGQIERDLAAARENATDFANQLRIAAEQTAVFGGDTEGSAALRQLAEGFRDGRISAEQFRDELRAFEATGQAYSGVTGDMAKQSFDAAEEIIRLEQALKDVRQAAGLAAAGATFIPEPPESGAAARGLFDAEQAKEAERKRKEAERLAVEAERPVKAFERLAESVVRSSGELERLRNIQAEVNELAEKHPALQGRAAELTLQIDDTILQESANQFAKIEASLDPTRAKLFEIAETQARINELVKANPELQERAVAVLDELSAAPVEELVERFRSMAGALSPAQQRLENMREIQRELNELAAAMPELAPQIQAASLEIDTSILEQTADQFRDIQVALDPNIARLERMREVQKEINDLVAVNPELHQRAQAVLAQLEQSYGRGHELLQAQAHGAGIVASELTDTATGAQSLEQGLTDIVTRISEAVIEALIFHAIMRAINPAGAGGVTGPGGGIGGLIGAAFLPAQHGGIIRRGSVASLPANNGGLFIEGNRDEAVLRLARTASGDLGVKAIGGGGDGGLILNIDARGADEGAGGRLANQALAISRMVQADLAHNRKYMRGGGPT